MFLPARVETFIVGEGLFPYQIEQYCIKLCFNFPDDSEAVYLSHFQLLLYHEVSHFGPASIHKPVHEGQTYYDTHD